VKTLKEEKNLHLLSELCVAGGTKNILTNYYAHLCCINHIYEFTWARDQLCKPITHQLIYFVVEFWQFWQCCTSIIMRYKCQRGSTRLWSFV